MLRLLAAAAACSAATALNPWSQRGATFGRSNFWVSISESEAAASAAALASASSAAAAAASSHLPPPPSAPLPASPSPSPSQGSPRRSAAAAPTPFPTAPIPALYSRLATRGFQLIKTSAPVVTTAGYVVFATGDCQLVVMPNPDDGAARWDSDYIWIDKTHQNLGVFAEACYDVAIDSFDNMYMLRHNNSFEAFVHGWYAFKNEGNPAEFLIDAATGAKGVYLGGGLRPLGFFSIGMTFMPDSNNSALLGDIWVPMTGTDGTCLAAVDLDSKPNPGAVKRFSCGGLTGQVGAAGGAGINIGLDTPPRSWNAAIFSNNGELGFPFALLTARLPNGTTLWSSDAVGEAGVEQPPPLVDDLTDRIFTIEHTLRGSYATAHCVDGDTGHPCAGWPAKGVPFEEVFKTADGKVYNSSWVYGGAAYFNADFDLQRIIYSVTLDVDFTNEPFPIEPTGCLVAISPNTGAELDFYCIPRDETSFYANVNYLATAPIVARNARGFGLSSVYVAQADMTVLAFNPLNLTAGPLFSVRPTATRHGSVGLSPNATVAADYMAMTAAGTLVIPYWEYIEAGQGGYGIVAIPNINSFVAPSPSPAPAPSGNSASGGAGGGVGPGGAAGISVAVILLAAGAFVFVSGGVRPALERLTGAASSSAASLLGRPAPAKYAFVGGSSYGSTSSAGAGVATQL